MIPPRRNPAYAPLLELTSPVIGFCFLVLSVLPISMLVGIEAIGHGGGGHLWRRVTVVPFWSSEGVEVGGQYREAGKPRSSSPRLLRR